MVLAISVSEPASPCLPEAYVVMRHTISKNITGTFSGMLEDRKCCGKQRQVMGCVGRAKWGVCASCREWDA